jgi:hypothetical protein
VKRLNNNEAAGADDSNNDRLPHRPAAPLPR